MELIRLQKRTLGFPFLTVEADVRGLIEDNFPTTSISQKDGAAKIGDVV